MPRSKSDVGTTVIKLRVENTVLREAKALAKATKRDNISAILRAAVKYGINELTSTPMLVNAIEAGMLDDPDWLNKLEELRERADKVQTLFGRHGRGKKAQVARKSDTAQGVAQTQSEQAPADRLPADGV
jgi:hypothetical protein